MFIDFVTIAYFYNPFKVETFASVMDRLVTSVDRNPRRLRILYGNPVEHDAVIATARQAREKGSRATADSRLVSLQCDVRIRPAPLDRAIRCGSRRRLSSRSDRRVIRSR